MFTIKFYRAGETQFLSTPHFAVHDFQEGYEVCLYKTPTIVEGVCYRISKAEQDFDSCYVENLEGKTIHALYAHRPPQLASA